MALTMIEAESRDSTIASICNIQICLYKAPGPRPNEEEYILQRLNVDVKYVFTEGFEGWLRSDGFVGTNTLRVGTVRYLREGKEEKMNE